MSVAVVVGNPQPASRTLAAATYVARELSGADPDLVVDLGSVWAALLDFAYADWLAVSTPVVRRLLGVTAA
jgi:FMN reductase